MTKKLIILFVIIITSHTLHAAPVVKDQSTVGIEIQDRIDRRTREIEMMSAYSARLESILLSAGYSTPELLGDLTLDQKLDRALPSVHGDGARLDEALRSLSIAAGVEIAVDWKTLAGAGIAEDTPVTFRAKHHPMRAVLRDLLDAAGGDTTKLSFMVENGKVIVTTAEKASTYVFARTYDIAPLVAQYRRPAEGMDRIVRIITDTVATDSWKDAGGTTGSINVNGTRLTITQTKDNLRDIEGLLEQLDDNKRAIHQRKLSDDQDTRLAALGREIDKNLTRCRSLGIHPPARLDQAIKALLPDAQFVDTPLATCFKTLGESSGQLIYVDWEKLEAAGISRRLPITLILHQQTFASALQLLINKASSRDAPLQYGMEDNAIHVSTREEFDKVTVTRVYDIRKILPPGRSREESVEALENMILKKIEPDSWKDAGGVTGSLRELQGMLIVTQTERTHVVIKAFLEQMAGR